MNEIQIIQSKISQFVMTSRAKCPKAALLTRAQLDAISEALAELQAKESRQKARQRIGFIQNEEEE